MTLLSKNLAKYKIPEHNDKKTEEIPKLDEGVLNTTPLERYTSRFMQYMPQKESLTDYQKSCLEEFALSLEHIDNQLKPFRDAGINYTLNLAGGAVRDFLLGKQETIKDHDLFLHFFDTVPNQDVIGEAKMPRITSQMVKDILGHAITVDQDYIEELSRENLRREKIRIEDFARMPWNSSLKEPVTWFDDQLNQHIMAQVCLELLEKNNQVSDFFTDTQRDTDNSSYKRENYLNNAMYANIKIHNPLTKPIDLILCKCDSFQFVETFDFSICKASIDYRNSLGKLNFKDNVPVWENVFDNVLVSHSFLKDVQDNTISINLKDFTPEHIEYFMSKHYVKIKDKYPERELKLMNKVENVPELKKEKDAFYFILLPHKLEHELDNKNNKLNKVKI